LRAEDYTPGGVEEKAALWLETIRDAVPHRSHLQLHPDRCALLVVDMNHWFVRPGGRAFLPAAPRIIPNIQRLLHCWRNAGRSVVFTRHGHRDEVDDNMLRRFFGSVIPNDSEDADIVDALAPGPGETVIAKDTYDAFFCTDLESHLRHAGATQVLIAGVLTHMCCETTARSAFCRGFEVYLPVDAMASTTEERHVQSLLSLSTCVAVPLSTREVLAT
jgi:isochorismate hydrolase